jgi:DNA-binding PadR family transcriptional regulator
MESSNPESPLTDEQRAELKEVHKQMQQASSFLNDLVQAWNHAGVQEYQDLEETARAAESARDAAKRATEHGG